MRVGGVSGDFAEVHATLGVLCEAYASAVGQGKTICFRAPLVGLVMVVGGVEFGDGEGWSCVGKG